MVDDDVPLIEGCRQGRAGCYQQLYDKYSGKVYGFARRFLGDEQYAEDVTQEVFLRVFRKLSTFRGEARFSTWLFRVSLNSCKNKRRSLERDQRFDPDRFRELRRHIEESPERALECSGLQGRIDAALRQLPDGQRSVLLLKAVEELSYREIGRIFGQTENQIRGRLYRARKAFRTALAVLDDGEGSFLTEEIHAGC